MTLYSKLLIPLTLLINTLNHNVFAQEKSDVSAEAIINKFISKIGGEKWWSLKSRKEYAFVEYEEDKKSVIPNKSYDRIKINSHPGLSIEVHNFIADRQNILVLKSECNRYYSSRSQVVKFFGPDPVKFDTKFPRTELMETLDLEPMKKVYLQDTLYRVDFRDIRQLDGKQSLYFGMNSGLVFQESIYQ